MVLWGCAAEAVLIGSWITVPSVTWLQQHYHRTTLRLCCVWTGCEVPTLPAVSDPCPTRISVTSYTMAELGSQLELYDCRSINLSHGKRGEERQWNLWWNLHPAEGQSTWYNFCSNKGVIRKGKGKSHLTRHTSKYYVATGCFFLGVKWSCARV